MQNKSDNAYTATVLIALTLFFGILQSPDLPENGETSNMANNRINALWCTCADTAADVAAEAVAGNITVLNLQVGNWQVNSGGTVYGINEWYTGQEEAWIAAAKAVEPTLKVYAWVLAMTGYNGEVYDVDVDDAANRAGILSIASNYIVTTTSGAFDGFCDDIESIDGASSNLAVLWNQLGAAMHGIGKDFAACVIFYSYGGSYYTTGGDDPSNLYPYLDEDDVDFVYPMMYPDANGPYAPSYTKTYMDWILHNCNCYVAIGLCVRPQGDYSITLTEQLDGIAEQIAAHGEYTNFVGCCLWEYDTILAADWTVWDAWGTKDGPGGVINWEDTFETGTFDKWTGDSTSHGAISVTDVDPIAGTYSAKSVLDGTAGAWAREYISLGSSYNPKFFARGRVRVDTLPSAGNYVQLSPMISIADASVTLVDIRIYNDAGTYKWAMRYYKDAGSAYSYANAPVPAADTTYYCQVGVLVDAADGWAKAWVSTDGNLAEGAPTVSETTLANDDAGDIGRVQIGTYASGAQAVTWKGDDMKWDTEYIPYDTPPPPIAPLAYFLMMRNR